MTRRIQAVLFDVIETLFPLEPVRRKLTGAGLPASALETWFARLLRDAFALDAAGSYRGFREVAAGALEVTFASSGRSPSREAIDEVLGAFAELDPHPDVASAFERLAEAGVTVTTLTNGSAENTRKLLERASLQGHVRHVIGVDEVKHWKPRREVYLHGARVVGVEPRRVALVAAHAWDVLGAREAGLATGWVSRLEKTFHPAMGRPEVSGGDLVAVVDWLLALE
jgi:2-haloacid dehalogenase